MKLLPQQARVLNFRNIDDSSWVPLERVTALVGCNESGKTAFLKALHKFNPAIDEPYNAQREFPRDRFTSDYKKGGDWPVCMVDFELAEEFRTELRESLGGFEMPKRTVVTRFYDGTIVIECDCNIPEDLVDPSELAMALDEFAGGVRRLEDPDVQNETIQELRVTLVNWVEQKKDSIMSILDLRSETGVEMLRHIREEANRLSQPNSAVLVERIPSQGL